MTTFHEREQAFEAKFAWDEEFRFRTLARRDKLFAGWVAETLGLSGAAAEALVKAILAIPNTSGHDQSVLRHVADEFSTHGTAMSERRLTVELKRCMQQARQQLMQMAPTHGSFGGEQENPLGL